VEKFNENYILTFAAQLLHPAKDVDITFFPASSFFWKNLVKYASGHLVLPAIYSALKRKNLVDEVPNDLLIYLKEISKINCERNKEILKQIFFLSKILKENNIGHIFLKGAAMLILKPYNTLSDRMIGDIDILILNNSLEKAQSILIKNGYSNNKQEDLEFTNDVDKISKKHLHRIVHPDFISAVELHRELLDENSKNQFSANQISQHIGFLHDIPIPSKMNLWKHAIFNWQFNDNGFIYNNFSLRSYLDVIYLEPQKIDNKLMRIPAISHFYSLCSVFIDSYKNSNATASLIFRYKLRNSKFRFLFNSVITFRITFSLICKRLLLFIQSKVYRKNLLENPKLILKKIYFFWKKH